jgi:hypothetical protein
MNRTKSEIKAAKAREQIKDREDYRRKLITQRNALDVKIAGAEEQIRKLKRKGEAVAQPSE